jgi:hypothetical protein
MPAPATRSSEGDKPLEELDRVKLIKAVHDKGRLLGPGLTGTVVLCHGSDAYEVEFDSIDDDFFQIPAEYLEKI